MSDPLQEPLVMKHADSLRWLNRLLEFYSGEEERCYLKLWGPEPDQGAWSTGFENEWMRYRQEAAALRAGIAALQAQREVKP